MAQAAASAAESEQDLHVTDVASIKSELDFGTVTNQEKAGLEQELDVKADSLVSALTDFDQSDENKKQGIRSAVENMGYQVQKDAAKQSEMLKRPLNTIKSRSEDGGNVAKALIDLKIQVEDLDPARFDFSAGWFSRMLGYLPGVGTPIKRYFSRFESAQTVIDAVIHSLEQGRETLKRDNITLAEDQKRMRQMTRKLEKAIALGQLMDQKLVYKLEREIPQEDPRHKFIQEEVLFTLRQRIQDLQQQLAVNQQGVLAMEIIIRNNKELIRGVNRALNVTVSALQVAVTVAMALENQKVVLDKINALSQTTDSLIAGTAQRLRQQGAEIHKQAASTTMNMDTLKKAFEDINAAMEDIAKFRSDALPQMAQNILEMDQLNQEAEKAIVKMEQGKKVEPSVAIEIE